MTKITGFTWRKLRQSSHLVNYIPWCDQ